MKIRKIYLFILFITAFVVLYSCQSRFNPKYYYNKSASDIGDTGGDDFPDDFDPDIDYDDPSEDNTSGDGTNGSSTTVYLDPFVHGEWNDPNYRFNIYKPKYLTMPNSLLTVLQGVSGFTPETPLSSFYLNSIDFGLSLGLQFRG